MLMESHKSDVNVYAYKLYISSHGCKSKQHVLEAVHVFLHLQYMRS